MQAGAAVAGILALGAFWYLINTGVVGGERAQEGDTVRITDDGFVPETLCVRRGASIHFRNETKERRWPASNLHPTHTVYSEFDPKQALASGVSWEFVFERPGIWEFHDHLSPFMTGTILVMEDGRATAGSESEHCR